jgi:hypothetical protein
MDCLEADRAQHQGDEEMYTAENIFKCVRACSAPPPPPAPYHASH